MQTVLFPDYAHALAFRRRHSGAKDPYAFAAAVSSLDAWIADLWDLYGDGRALATKNQRIMAFLRVLEEAQGEALPQTGGMAQLLMRLANEALGSSEFDAVVQGTLEVPQRHRPLVDAVCSYEHMLTAAGLVDAGRACALLAQQPEIYAGGSALLYDIALTAAQSRLVHAVFDAIDFQESHGGRVERLPEGVDLRFAFPSGRYAEPFLLASFIKQRVPQGGVLITAKTPFALYESLEEALEESNIVCAVRARRPFFDTAFGRAYRCVSDILQSERVHATACADFLLNPFSGVSTQTAYRFDCMVRGDRLLTKERCIEALRDVSRSFSYFEDLVESPDADALIGYFEDRARSLEYGAAFVSEQLAALSALRDVMAAARCMGLSARSVETVLQSTSVDVSRSSCDDVPDVLIVDAWRADAVEPSLWPTVVMCDMDNASFPVKNADDAASSFAECLGIARPRRALADLRDAFAATAAKAQDMLVIERCLNDDTAAPTYPAATVEEFVDCYRVDPTDTSDIDNKFSLPPCLMGGLIERGEEALYENAAVRDGAQESAAVVPAPTMAEVRSDEARSAIVLPRIAKGGVPVSGVCLSPSQIESYLECPQKWFALRRLRLDDLDEGFGAVEMGDFSHSVFEDFYRRFQGQVAAKVAPDTLGVARNLMHDVIAEHRSAQFDRKPGNNRLVPISVYEEREMEDLEGKLVGYLNREAELLPGFAPYAFEYEIPVEQAFEYAGCTVTGKIDRIDVDDRGRAVVIDYKSSLSSDYNLRASEKQGGLIQEGKVQALVYAQAVRRLLGFEVVGALYVSYGRIAKAAGAIDKSIEPKEIPGMKGDLCTYQDEYGPGFTSLLDATEARVARSLEALRRGEIAPAPLNGHVCSYCPELSCPQRRG